MCCTTSVTFHIVVWCSSLQYVRSGQQPPTALLHVRVPLPPRQQERGVQLRQVRTWKRFQNRDYKLKFVPFIRFLLDLI